MITGFNTDIKFGGVTYHVQTEDKGLKTPLILSLVYVGGTIIASKRTPYQDLVETGYDEGALTERLQRQHKLICAAIRAGRVEELKKMSEAGPGQASGGRARKSGKAASNGAAKKAPAAEEGAAEGAAAAGEAAQETAGETVAEAPSAQESAPAAAAEQAPAGTTASAAVPPAAAEAPKETAREAAEASPAREAAPAPKRTPAPESVPASQPEAAAPPAPAPAPAPPAAAASEEFINVVPVEVLEPDDDRLYLNLLDDEGEFRAGQLATIKVQVGRGAYGHRAAADAAVTIKVLGTSFRPLVLSTRTDREGVAVVRALLPRFTSGRAAIVIRASAGKDVAELRRIIHQD